LLLAIVFLLAFIGLLFLLEKLIETYSKRAMTFQWLLFLPISIVRSLLSIAIIYAVFGFIFPINKQLLMSICWSVSPIVMLVTIYSIIPKAKIGTTIALGGLWIVFSIGEIFMKTDFWQIRIPQILIIAGYLSIKIAKQLGSKRVAKQ